ncbi:peroxidase 43 [Citrus sinensis]|uniref:Peroxidase 43 n=1 Tax=Citrus sinensis TaxID=2711 RepID=A0ACB8KCX6_CITSI|nr:peroxidase 43 [Citrus sinensis]
MALFYALLFALVFLIRYSAGQLKIGFYSETCPEAESTVSSVVQDAVVSDPNLAAVLLRLHFHDCFVEGCDGSILIENGPNAEKHAFGHQGVGGFEVIEKAKARLEDACPGVVSCADIVALAARDAIALSNGPSYQVPTGRRDGEVSNVTLADDMPDVSDSIQQLKTKFLHNGLSEKDLVLLSAAHTIGTTACFFMTKRLYNFFPGGGSDPGINPSFLVELKATCPQNGDVNVRLPIDRGSERVFDKQILQNIKDGFAVLESDSRLNDDIITNAIIDSYLGILSPIFGPSFEADFVESIVKMGHIGVKTGQQGHVRRLCAAFS